MSRFHKELLKLFGSQFQFNNNHLGHDFVDARGYYSCHRCNIIVYNNINNDIIVSHRCKLSDGICGFKLNLTCDEVIIKYIIE